MTKIRDTLMDACAGETDPVEDDSMQVVVNEFTVTRYIDVW